MGPGISARDLHLAAFRVQAHGLDGALDQCIDLLPAQMEHLTGLAEKKQRFDEVRHALHCFLHFKMQFCSFLRRRYWAGS